MQINYCPFCTSENLDSTTIDHDHIAVICHDCGQVFEVKNADSIAELP